MYVVMGHTRGDDLIVPAARALFAHHEHAECVKRMAEIQREHDEWLAANPKAINYMNACSIYARFEVVKTTL